MWEIILKYMVVGFFVGLVTFTVASIFYCFAVNGGFDVRFTFYPYNAL